VDGDGIPNLRDRDSDNDGITDIVEAGGVDSDQDGGADTTTDADGDGLSDLYDIDCGGSSLPIPDSDGDFIPDFIDLDSDGDGLSDRIEGQDIFAFRGLSGLDSDTDGIDNAFDINISTEPPRVPDSDGDGSSDYTDRDSDGDGYDDYDEAFDFDRNGSGDVLLSGLDSNSDGLDDAFGAYDNPESIMMSWREVSASLNCERIDLQAEIRSIKTAASTITKRAASFAAKIRSCGGRNRMKQALIVRKRSQKLSQELLRVCGGLLYQCPEQQCTVTSIRSDKRRFQAMSRDIASRQKRIKLETIRVCGHSPPKHGHVDRRKNTDDYLRDLLRAIRRLPEFITRCP